MALEETTGHERAVERQLAKIADDLATIRFAVWTWFMVWFVGVVLGLVAGVAIVLAWID